ncbi:MAG: pilus assembly protein [Elusimicrobia bacterium]|nr:pilus assembly protein [Elusimicrobiota bacterium]
MLRGEKGQGVVESLLVTILFLTAVIFAMVQLCMIGYGWLRANDAAQAGVRCAIVAKGATASSNEAKNAAQYGITYCLGAGLPAKATLYEKTLGNLKDRAGRAIRMFSAHAYYIQRLMFASLLQPIAGDKDPFIKSRGLAGGFYGGGVPMLDVSRKYGVTGAAHCRMVKSPDWEYYKKSWKDGPEW